jgi:P-type Ca2+ transporter type 2C
MGARQVSPLRRPFSEPDLNIENGVESRKWHQLDTPEILHLLRTSEGGLNPEEARHRLSIYGRNSIELKERHPPFRILLGQFANFMILVLIAAAIVSGIIGDIKDTVVIAAIVVLNGIIGFIQEYRAERALEALQKMATPTANVIRNGSGTSIPAAEIVPGDILVLEAGGIVPADLRLIESVQLRTDEAALTGESQPVEKAILPLQEENLPLADRSNMAYTGTFVRHGRGRGVAVATGIETEFGRIATMLHATETTQTPLQRRLEQFGKRLAVIALLVAGFIFLFGVLRGESLILMFLTAVSLAVAAIPEALPAVVTIALALGARRMVQKQALVRRLTAVEALGSVTVICSDKTGTLTQNRMSVEQFYCSGDFEKVPKSDPPWDQLLLAMALSNDVSGDDASPLGDPTEVALLAAAKQAGVHKRILESRYPRVAEIPFDSGRKSMTTVHLDPAGGSIAFTKGATESLVDRAVDQITASGTGPLRADELLNAADKMAELGLRVLALAMRRWSEQPVDLVPDVVEKDLTIIGLVGIGDPIRKEAAEAIQTCHRAGIATTMITGDHPSTAKAVSIELGILDQNGRTWTGRELMKATEEELADRIESVRVFARVAPEQKLTIVRALQARGHLVAMTGDGVNDAPALKQAEIGVAMGTTGTDVARQASSLILLDDNFATIVGAVREGRKIYDNLRRFVRYAVTTNSSEILIMLIAPLLGLPIPLLPLQILWINLLTDGLPGLALAVEPEEPNIMSRPPRPPNESIFARGLGFHVVWVGSLMAALAVATQIVALNFRLGAWQTMVISVVAFSQLAHAMAIRSESESLFKQGLLSNKPLMASVLLMILFQFAVIYTSILNRLFSTQPLRPVEFAWTVICGVIIFSAVEIEKWMRRTRRIS